MAIFRLRTLIAVATSIIVLTLTLGISYVIERDAVDRLERAIGLSLAQLADAAQDKLDRAMYGKLEDLKTLASVSQLSDASVSVEAKKLALTRFQAANRDFPWVGYARRDGVIISSTSDGSDTVRASGEAWFEKGLLADYVGEASVTNVVRSAYEHGPALNRNFLSISVPVPSLDPDAVGVLGSQLSSGWAEEIRDGLIGGLANNDKLDVLILNESMKVIIGPSNYIGTIINLPSIRSAKSGQADYATEVWQDGDSYLTGFSISDGYQSYNGLHWIVIVREKRNEAFASVIKLRSDIVRWGTLFAAVATLGAWLVAGRLSRPLLRLASAAEDLRLGKQAEIAQIDGYQEVSVLSRSLRSLVNELTLQKAALAKANLSLEGQVHERTKQLEDQNVRLKRAKAEAETATEGKSRFLAAASHDLRQPLHALTLFARALSRRVSGDEAPKLVEQMEEALRALKGMFDALLNVSRLDAQMIQPDIQTASVADIIDRVSVGFRAEAQQHGLKFCSRRADWTIETDPALFETILRNLISNAFKFTRAGGVILAARRRAGRCVIDVYDTGPGVATEQRDRIFEEFARTEERALGMNDGLGLGLYIARRYCDLLGMKIQLCTRLGHGSRFSIVMPQLDPIAPARFSPAAPSVRVELEGMKILVVDDEALIVTALCRDLEDRGNKAYGFGSSADAESAVIGGLSVDAAIIDFDLRGLETGVQFIDRMGERLGRTIPTLILSGGTDSETMTILGNSGKPWLTKPADPDFIVATLSAQLSKGNGPVKGDPQLARPEQKIERP